MIFVMFCRTTIHGLLQNFEKMGVRLKFVRTPDEKVGIDDLLIFSANI